MYFQMVNVKYGWDLKYTMVWSTCFHFQVKYNEVILSTWQQEINQYQEQA